MRTCRDETGDPPMIPSFLPAIRTTRPDPPTSSSPHGGGSALSLLAIAICLVLPSALRIGLEAPASQSQRASEHRYVNALMGEGLLQEIAACHPGTLCVAVSAGFRALPQREQARVAGLLAEGYAALAGDRPGRPLIRFIEAGSDSARTQIAAGSTPLDPRSKVLSDSVKLPSARSIADH